MRARGLATGYSANVLGSPILVMQVSIDEALSACGFQTVETTIPGLRMTTSLGNMSEVHQVATASVSAHPAVALASNAYI